MGDKIEQQIQQPNPNLGAAEQILGALGMLGGSYLKARSLTGRSWLGDPLSLAGQGLLGLGQYGAENRKKQEEQDALAAALPNTPEGQLIGKLMKGGATVPEASELAKLNFPQAKELAPVKGVDAQGNPIWLTPGEAIPKGAHFYEKPSEAKAKTLSGDESILARQLGLSEDPSTWTPAQSTKYLSAETELKKARAATPLAVVMPAIGTGPDGAPVPGMAVAPRVGRSGIGAPTFTPFSGGTTPSALVGKVDKPPAGADTTNYSYGKSDKFPGLLIGRPKPAKGLIAKAGEYALPTPPIAYYKGRQLKVGDTFTYYPPKGRPVKVILEAKDLE